jgi:non-ribosomal peptide synthetase component E (peptide arylation enzyme)
LIEEDKILQSSWEIERASSFSGGAVAEEQFTLGQAIRRDAELLPGHPAVLSPAFAPLTYGDLQRKLDEIHIQLRQAGFDCSALIEVFLPNSPEAVLCRFPFILLLTANRTRMRLLSSGTTAQPKVIPFIHHDMPQQLPC